MSKDTINHHGGTIVEIPRETTFDLPEGNYAATISSVRKFMKQTSRGAQESIRILFEVTIPNRTNVINMAGRSFKLDFNNGSELRNFLTPLLGRQFFLDASGKTVDLDALLRMRCELELMHFHNADYEHPLVVVEGCHKPGTLKLTEPMTVLESLMQKGGKVIYR